MMKKIIAFAGSTSSTSINKQLVTYASSLVEGAEVEIIDMKDYTTKLYSSDEEQNGFPDNMIDLSKKLSSYDGFIVSLAEHNGSYASAFKNTLDWLSRVERNVFNEKPVLLMASSPGGRGGASVLGAAKSYFPFLGAKITGTFSFPGFYDNFKEGRIVDSDLNESLKNSVKEFSESI